MGRRFGSGLASAVKEMMADNQPEVTATHAVELVGFLGDHGVEVWVDGGWGIDALLGEQTRSHGDLDIAVRHRDVPELRRLLGSRGFSEAPRRDTSECMFVLADASGRCVDVHSFTFDDAGNHVFGVEYPLESLTGTGTILDHAVNCISPEWVVRFHCTYEPDDDDFRDVVRLCKRFDISLPTRYQRFLDSTR